MKQALCAVLLVWLMLPGGCAQATRPGTISHVVVVWLKQPGDAAARRAVIDGSRELSAIPGVRRVTVGPVLPSTRPAVDSGFDLALVITLADEAALRDYPSHPIHQRLLREVIRPLVERYRVYDFINE